MKLVVISDTHGTHRDLILPEGDILIHCGDISNCGELKILFDFNEWTKTLPYKHKIVIAGNHDLSLEKINPRMILQDVTYLQDEGVTIEDKYFWGSPYSPQVGHWAFGLKSFQESIRKWSLIPDETDVLITHGPPFHILDRLYTGESYLGCEALRDAIERVQPKYHFFGHIHEGTGVYYEGKTTFHNAAVLDYPSNRRHNLPIRTFEL